MASAYAQSGVFRVLFVCHGNICRSPMAEFIFKDIVRREGLADVIDAASAGTSAEELGCAVYPEARAYLRRIGIDPGGKRARVITRADFDDFDLIVAMERYNVRNLARYCPQDGMERVRLLREFTDAPGDIEDPWYSGNFDRVGDQIRAGCEGLFRWIRKQIL